MTENSTPQDFGYSRLSDIDKLSLFSLGRMIGEREDVTNNKMFAEKLDVALMPEYRNRFTVIERLLQPVDKLEKPPKEPMCKLSIVRDLIDTLSSRSFAIYKEPDHRTVIAPWLRSACSAIMKVHKDSSFEIARILGLSRSTVLHFSSAEPIPATRPLTADELAILAAWNDAPHSARASLDAFWSHFGRTYPDTSYSYETIRKTTLSLGLRQTHVKTENEGVSSQREFAPLSYWAGDGKWLDVAINGVSHRWLWYAFGCTGTSLFVGASVTKSEDSRAFLDALRNSESSVGSSPIGVLVDNRLGRPRTVDLTSAVDPDLPSDVLSFCKEHKIVIVHTWPGNPKSNLMENHFSVFAQHITSLNITGATTEELSASFARALIESFMKVRNHTPRRRFGGRTPAELVFDKTPDEADRPAIEQLKTRFNKHHRSFAERWALLLPETIACFTSLDEDGNFSQRMRKLLRQYSQAEIIAAQAAFHAQKSKNPEGKYDESYFFGILRHKREERAKQVYADVFRAGIHLPSKLPAYTPNMRELANEIVKYLSDIANEGSPVHQRYHLQALLFFLISISTKVSLPTLWAMVVDGQVRSNLVSCRWFSAVQEFAYEHVGDLLYEHPANEKPIVGSFHAPPSSRYAAEAPKL